MYVWMCLYVTIYNIPNTHITIADKYNNKLFLENLASINYSKSSLTPRTIMRSLALCNALKMRALKERWQQQSGYAANMNNVLDCKH